MKKDCFLNRHGHTVSCKRQEKPHVEIYKRNSSQSKHRSVYNIKEFMQGPCVTSKHWKYSTQKIDEIK